MGADLDSWIAKVRACEYLPENHLKQLCQMVRHNVARVCCSPGAHARRFRMHNWAMLNRSGADVAGRRTESDRIVPRCCLHSLSLCFTPSLLCVLLAQSARSVRYARFARQRGHRRRDLHR